MFQKSAKQWYYLDFRKRIILFSGSRDISYEAIPANIAMNELLVKMGRDSLTFAEYKEYLANNGITDAIYQFDGRSRKSVKYEPLEIGYMDMKYLLSHFADPDQVTVSDFVTEINRLTLKAKSETNLRLVDIAKKQLESVIDLLKKC